MVVGILDIQSPGLALGFLLVDVISPRSHWAHGVELTRLLLADTVA